MNSKVDETVGCLLRDARAATGRSLHEVAGEAGCSPAYVHKLEQDRVRTPSPRVLAGLARALGLDYGLLMRSAGYDSASADPGGPPPASPRYSNAHIVELLESLVSDVAGLRRDLARRDREP